MDENVAKSALYRIFVQHGGASPKNAYDFAGCLSLGGIQQDLGTGEPILCPSSEVRGQYDIVGTTSPPPALPTTDFTQHMDRLLRDFWWDLRKRGCEFNLAIVGSTCARPDDPDDFEAKILVAGSKLTAFNTGAFNTTDQDAAVDLTGSLLMRTFDRFLPLGFGQIMGGSVLTEGLDGMYADKVQCGDCGTPSDGCQRLYVLTINDLVVPLAPSTIAYSTDGGETSGSDEINSLVAGAARRIAQVGRYVVAVSDTDTAHHYKLQSSIDAGVVGGWARINSGYVALSGPRAIWSKSPSQTYAVGLLGYIYLMSKPTAPVTVLSDGSVTTQNLNDVRGFGNTVVAVGNSNAVVASSNNGKSWDLVTGPAVGVNLLTVEVITKTIWWVGCANGKGFFTTDAGDTWTEMDAIPGATAITMIRFVDGIVGYMTVTVGAVGMIFRTGDNGYSWHTDESSYLNGVPASVRYNFIAPCAGNYNQVVAGGIAAVGLDGVVALGAA